MSVLSKTLFTVVGALSGRLRNYGAVHHAFGQPLSAHNSNVWRVNPRDMPEAVRSSADHQMGHSEWLERISQQRIRGRNIG